jgi:hypothetical protein
MTIENLRRLGVMAVLSALVCGAGMLPAPLGVGVAQAADAAAEETAQGEFYYNLVLLRGRLAAGRELYLFVGDKKSAMIHFGPNVNARMANIEKLVGENGAKPLQDAINAHDALAKTDPTFAAFEAAYVKVVAETHKVESAITGGRLAKPAFVMNVLADVIAHAAEDYAAGVKDGKVTIMKEYQEIYGYNRAVVEELRRFVETPGGKALKDSASLRQDIGALEAAVPSPVPLVSLYTTDERLVEIANHLRAHGKS